MNKTNKKSKWLFFEEVREIVRKDVKVYNITGCKSWQINYVNGGFIPSNIPKQPYITYRKDGWVSWGDWLGTNSVCSMRLVFPSYQEAFELVKDYIKQYKINSAKKWYYEASLGHKSDNIPLHPYRKYKNKGWISWAHWLRTNNKVGGQRKYYVNEDFFKVWSHDMAYILGFWFADGNIKQNRVFSIYQHNKDRYLLQKILDRFADREFLYKDKRADFSYISISSKIIYKDLLNLGGIPAKSLRSDFPFVIPYEYIGDFLRGNFDGDGSIYYDKCNRKYFSCFTTGSKKFADGLKACLDKANVSCKIIVRKGKYVKIFTRELKKYNDLYYVRCNAANTIKLGEFFYRNSPDLKMDRKFDLFQKANIVMEKNNG